MCELLAAGGVGEVWRAEDTELDRTVAVKLLRPEHADSEEYRERLRLEGRHLAALSHPRLAEVHDYGDGREDERPYLVMELIDGEPLSAVLARERTLPPRRVVDIVAQAADGLACVHAAALVHRDMKPANLLVRPDGSVKITDFGIARGPETLRLTRTGQVIGTPLYLAPEQAAGYAVTPAGDLYSLGVIAWECLAGRPPFQGDDVLAVAIAHRDRPVPPLPDSVPEPVRLLVRALTAKDPAVRRTP
ncbi:serine/threonine-protein kinase [Actinoallomurus sp. NPDC052308]|uniref:serine/threonine-protein kinase n=1 Tax=Actinoallomurus sp. NPDC052308 TaxID=3155530 RepID=UPI003420413C